MTARRTIPIALPSLGEEEWQAVREPLVKGWVTQGPQVAAFEDAFAERHGVTHAVACASGTAALHLILAAIGIGAGDEVIVPAFTWVATANAVVYCGATPVFVDICPKTFNIDVNKLRESLTPRTKAIIAVHLFGLCADMEAIRDAAADVLVIEDAACAAGSSYQGHPAGSLGLAGAFSFHPRKAITTGEGGMVTTDNEGLASRVRALRNHGADAAPRIPPAAPHGMAEVDDLGFNYRMTDIHAAIGRVQLRKLDAFIEERREGAALYGRELARVPWLRLPEVPEGYGHCWQSYVLRVDESQAPLSRNACMEALVARGISTRPGTHAVPFLGFYRRKFGAAREDFPGADSCDRESMAIPIHNRMVEDDYTYVVEALRSLG